MRLFTTFLAVLLLGALLSCTDEEVDNADDTACLRAKFIANYCPSDKPLHLIQFLEQTELATKQTSQTSDSTFYLAAVLDLPDSVQKNGSVFYIKFYFDPEAEIRYQPNICQAVFSPVKILVCDGVSSQPCQ